MALDPVIAGGFRGLQLQDPLEQFGRISQIQQAQQQNALNALKMQEYQREMETENRLRALYARPDVNIRSPEFQREVFSVSPTRGAALQKTAFEAEKEKRLSDAALADLESKRIANARATLPAVTPETWGAWRADTLKNLPGLANIIPETYSDDAKLRLMQTADQYITGRKPMVVAPGASVFQPGATTPMFTAPVAPAKPTPAETEEIVLRLQDPNLPPASRKALQDRLRILTTREPKEPKEPALRTTKVELADGSIGVMDLGTGEITPAKVGGQIAKGKPSAFAEKTAAQRKQLGVDLDRTIGELTEVTKKGGLIDQATGSGIGRAIDVSAGFFGQATPGAIAIGKLAPIADMVLKMVPRFEGPQSDKDTRSYKEAAGQLADPTLPNEIRKQAALQIVRLMKARKNEFVTADMATEGVGAAPRAAPAAGVDTSNPLLK